MHPHRMATAWHGIASHASKGCAAAAGWAHAPASSPREDERECERRKGVRDQVPGLCVCVCRVKEREGWCTNRPRALTVFAPKQFSAGGGGGEERGEGEGEGRGRAEPAEL